MFKVPCDAYGSISLSISNEEQKMAVWDSLIANGSGQRTYLWVKLIFKELEKNRILITEVLRDLVKSTPRDIFETYDLLFKRVKDKDHCRVQIIALDVLGAQASQITRDECCDSNRRAAQCAFRERP